MRAPTAAVVIALGVGLLTGTAPVEVGASAPGVRRSAAAVTAATTKAAKVPGRQIRIVLSGDRLGQRAMIQLVGVRGPAKGADRVVGVNTRTRVKPLRPGRYRLVPLAIATATGRATAKPAKATITARRGATARIVYRPAEATPPPPPIRPGTVTAGDDHTCAIDDAGKAWCWGLGSAGRLGDGITADHVALLPVAVVGDHTFTQLTSSAARTCGLDEGGKAWCWGDGSRGQLGDGNVGDHSTATPVAVVGGHTFTQLTAGNWQNTCGIDATGSAWCWGSGAGGLLGDGDASFHVTGIPVPVTGGHTFTQLTAGRHACGLDDAGKAWCWGDGSSGQLGDGNLRGSATPVAVVGGHTFTHLAAGVWQNTCGIDDAGLAWCWGSGMSGIRGDGDARTSQVAPVPVAVVGGHIFAQVNASAGPPCGTDASGKAWCWGDGRHGLLGGGATSTHFSRIPVPVVGGHTFTQLTSGGLHRCGIDDAGKAWCWGDGNHGKLGDGNISDHSTGTPVAVMGGHTFKQVVK